MDDIETLLYKMLFERNVLVQIIFALFSYPYPLEDPCALFQTRVGESQSRIHNENILRPMTLSRQGTSSSLSFLNPKLNPLSPGLGSFILTSSSHFPLLFCFLAFAPLFSNSSK